MRTALTLLSAALCATLACGAAPSVAHEAKASATKGMGEDYTTSVRRYAVPDVVLTDADAKPVRLRDVLASPDPVMLNFVFTTCGTVCPIMVRVFSEVPGKIGAASKNLRMISISIDPEHDTPAQLKTYAASINAGSRWHFLTGRVEDVRAVQRAFDGYRGDKMNHDPLTLMRQGPDRPWVRIDGFAGADQLAREYRKLAAQ